MQRDLPRLRYVASLKAKFIEPTKLPSFELGLLCSCSNVSLSGSSFIMYLVNKHVGLFRLRRVNE